MISARQLSRPPPAGDARQAQRVRNRIEQYLAVERLGQEAEHAAARRGHRLGNRAVRGENDHRERRRIAVDRVKQRHAIHAVHAQVGDDEIRPRDGKACQSAFAGIGSQYRVSRRPEPHCDELQQILVVIDKQDVGASLVIISSPDVSQLLFALDDAAFNRFQCFKLLLQFRLPFLGGTSRAFELLAQCQPRVAARCALSVGAHLLPAHFRAPAAAGPQPGPQATRRSSHTAICPASGERLEQRIRGLNVPARRRKRGQERRKPQPVDGTRVALERVPRHVQARCCSTRRRACGGHRLRQQSRSHFSPRCRGSAVAACTHVCSRTAASSAQPASVDTIRSAPHAATGMTAVASRGSITLK